MALVFVPTLGSIFGAPGGTADAATMKAVAAGESGDLGAIKGWTGRYLAVLGFALRHPATIVLAAVLVLVAVVVASGSLRRGAASFPAVEPTHPVVHVPAPAPHPHH